MVYLAAFQILTVNTITLQNVKQHVQVGIAVDMVEFVNQIKMVNLPIM